MTLNDAPNADEPGAIGRATQAHDLDQAAGVRRVNHPPAPDVDADVPEPGKEEQVAGLHSGTRYPPTLVIERVRTVREFDADSSVCPVDETGAVEPTGGGGARPPLRAP